MRVIQKYTVNVEWIDNNITFEVDAVSNDDAENMILNSFSQQVRDDIESYWSEVKV